MMAVLRAFVAALLPFSGVCLAHETVPLDGRWEYQESADWEGVPPEDGWTPCDVPHRVSVDFDEHLWYRRTFHLEDMDFRRAYLRLWGAKFAPRVLLGGREVGRAFDGFVPSTFDVTGFLSQGTNTLHIACRSYAAMTDGEVDFSGEGRSSELIRGHVLGPIGSQWTAGGLWEGVELVLCGELYIKDAFVKTSVRTGEVEVEVTVSSHDTAPRTEVLRAWVEPVRDPPFRRGDANHDGKVGMVDVITTLLHVFARGDLPCRDAADASDDGKIDLVDVITILLHLFTASFPLPAPSPDMGADPTADDLGCAGDVPAFPPLEITMPPGVDHTVSLKAPWPRPVLWSPENPFLYRLRLAAGDEAHEVRFGFREFWCDGPEFYLNGVRRRLLAASSHPRVFTVEDARREIEFFLQEGAVAFRFHAQPWSRYWYDLSDEMGLLVVHESALWCGYYRWEDERFWQYAREHVRGNVIRDRNHPSIVIWSIENEALLCGADRFAESEARLAALGQEVRRLDPTRPIMFDGDDDPMGSADIINLHYPQEPPRARTWPDVAWWLEGPAVVHNWPRGLWEWSREKPLYIGEFLWLSPEGAHTPTIFTGDRAYLDFRAAREETKASTWEIAIRAYRGLDVTGMCPWNIVEEKGLCRDANRGSYRKVAAFLREYENRFFGGTALVRTVYLHNDLPEPVEGVFSWELRCGDVTREGSIPIDLEPTGIRVEALTVPLPEVAVETQAVLTLRIARGEEELFHDELAWLVAPVLPLPRPAGLGLFDPGGRVKASFRDEGIPFADIGDLSRIEGGTTSIVVGEDAFGTAPELTFAPEGPGASLERFVEEGGQVLILRQRSLGWLVPFGLSENTSTIGFVRSPDHPALEGITDDDLRFWYPGHKISEKEIYKGGGTATVALIDSGSSTGLSTASLMELRRGSGRYLLCQLDLIEKARSAPQARRILGNLLEILDDALPLRPELGILAGEGPFLDVMNGLSVEGTTITAPEDLSSVGAVVADASMALPSSMASALGDFVSAGGILLLHGLTPESLASVSILLSEGLSLSEMQGPVFLSGDGPVPGLANYHLQWFGPREAHRRPGVVPDIAPYVLERPFDLADFGILEAEAMALPAQGVNRRADGVWFYANATATAAIEIQDGGRYLLGVKGYGTPLDDVYPQAELALDGRVVGVVSMGAEETVRVLSADLPSGGHEVSVSFTNDAYSPPQDRNLFLDAVLYGPDPDPGAIRTLTVPPALSVCRRGEGEVWIDQVNAEGASGTHADLAGQYLSLILTHLGAGYDGDRYACVIAAEEFTPRGLPDYGVSGGTAWLNYTGEIWARVRWASAGSTEFVVHASGTPCAGAYPHVELKLDGGVLAEFDIGGEEIRPYRLGPFSIGAGLHEVAVAFTNDAWDPPQDRNLKVRKVVLRTP